MDKWSTDHTSRWQPRRLYGVKLRSGHTPILAPEAAWGLNGDVARARCGRSTRIPTKAPEALRGNGYVGDRATSRFKPRKPYGDQV